MSVTASRMLIDKLCAVNGIPLLVLHDFDKSGFSIAGTLQRSTRRYAFESTFEVIELGLRLSDVEKWALDSEEVAYRKSNPAANLHANGATREEIAFLLDLQRSTFDNFVGRRVELNAFPSADFVAWIEAGLEQHGIKKVVPNDATLEMAYRRATANAIVDRRIQDIIRQAKEEAAAMQLPADLQERVRERLKADRALPWDLAVADLARSACKR